MLSNSLVDTYALEAGLDMGVRQVKLYCVAVSLSLFVFLFLFFFFFPKKNLATLL